MSWICDICSSANEDSTTECFVCGQARSRESILLERRERRERKTKKIFTSVDKASNIIFKTIFIIATVFCAILTSILIIKKATNGDMGDIIDCLISLGNNGISNFTGLFSQIGNLFEIYFGKNILSTFDNISVVFGGIGAQFVSKWKQYSEVIFQPIGEKFSGFFNNIAFCMGILWGNLVGLWTIIKLLFEYAVNSGKKFGANVTTLIDFFKSKFS